MKTKIGVMLFILGICMGDSENLLIPMLFIGAGMWLAREVVTW